MDSIDTTQDRLSDQINWYNSKSIANQKWYKRLKLIQIVASSIISASAVSVIFGARAQYLTAALGILITIAEGIQSLNHFQQNWVNYRSTCERLKQDKYLWIGKAGPYANAPNPDSLLAERIEAIIAHENAQWPDAQQQQQKPPPGPGS